MSWKPQLSEKMLASILKEYTFVDFGCSTGSSIEFGRVVFDGDGVGLDIAHQKVAKARANGYDAVQCDISKLKTNKDGKTKYVLLSHFLEHVSPELATKCIQTAAHISSDLFFIRQPFFDADGYLFRNGLKLFWSHWRGHINHMNTLQMYSTLKKLQDAGEVKHFVIGHWRAIKDSSAPEVHPLASGIDQLDYDGEVHASKPELTFAEPVYRELCAFGIHDEEAIPPGVQKFIDKCDIVYDSRLVAQDELEVEAAPVAASAS